ncbi:MAG TPA: glycosyltransferase [Stellaceae bacterium]|nr:glycosyltransferase [Stellaceae bacterium]
MRALRVNHVLSTGLLKSYIFEDLFYRTAALAPDQLRVTQSVRPDPRADAWHYHRANLEWRLLPRSVATVHHDLRDDHGWLKLKYFIPRYREAAVVHCLNRTQQAVLRDHGILHSCVIPHGVDRRIFPSPAYPRQIKSDRLCLGMCSRRHPSGVKGEDLFESLLRHLDPRRISFVLVGEGRRQDAELARSKGFEAACWEYLPYPLMGEVYARMDALLILSWFEGGPASLPEALGSGVPVICTPVGMCADFVEDGINGLLLTRQAMSDGARIMALTDNAGSGMAVLNDGAFASAPTIPSWDAVMAEWHQLYRRAAEAAETPLRHRRSSAASATPTTHPTEQNRRAPHPNRAARPYPRDILPPPFPGSNQPVVLVCDPADCGAAKSRETTPSEICRQLIGRMLEQSDVNLISYRCQLQPVHDSLSPQYRLRLRVIDAVPLAEILRYVDIFVACGGYALVQGWRSGLKPLQIGNKPAGGERFSHVFPDIEALVQSVTHGLTTRLSLPEYSEMAAIYPKLATFDEADTAPINDADLVERQALSTLQSIERNSRTLLQTITDALINPLAASRLVFGSVSDLRQDRRYFSV